MVFTALRNHHRFWIFPFTQTGIDSNTKYYVCQQFVRMSFTYSADWFAVFCWTSHHCHGKYFGILNNNMPNHPKNICESYVNKK